MIGSASQTRTKWSEREKNKITEQKPTTLIGSAVNGLDAANDGAGL